MERKESTKVIVTNWGALEGRYGRKTAMVNQALNKLIAADQKRGLRTRVIDLGDAGQMRELKAPVAQLAADERRNKQAIDGVCQALEPHYLMILGSPDVVPHQVLANPVRGDEDPNVPSDLPYACETGFSREIARFKAPTRVVGRLADVTGSKDPKQLVQLLATATGGKSLARSEYETYFAVSAEVWIGSTSQSLLNIFGSNADLKISPPKGPNWPPAQLGARSHFINCHGGDHTPTWYGQHGNNYPDAVQAFQISGKTPIGAVAAAECCYGAQLYDPAGVGGAVGICNTYLGNGAYGFCGSTNIAYGPSDGQGEADLIAQYFLKNVLDGASLGRAFLSARQRFLQVNNPPDPVDLKTLAQFILLGDPSIHPVLKLAAKPKAVRGKGPGLKKLNLTEAHEEAAGRWERRQKLMVQASLLEKSVRMPRAAEQVAVPDHVHAIIKEAARNVGMVVKSLQSFEVETGPVPKMRGKAFAPPERFHLAYSGNGAKEKGPSVPTGIVVVVRERGGAVLSTKVLHAK